MLLVLETNCIRQPTEEASQTISYNLRILQLVTTEEGVYDRLVIKKHATNNHDLADIVTAEYL